MFQKRYNLRLQSQLGIYARFTVKQENQYIHEEQLEAILANAVDSIITINQHGIIESVNPATESMFGYQLDELIGKNVKILMPAPYRDEHDRYVENYLTTGHRKIIGIGREVTAQKKDGTVFPVHLAVSEIHIGDRVYFTGVIRDISDVKKVEAKLVQNERLAAIGQMMAGLAHESRNAFQRSHACLTNLAFDVREMPESLELVHKVQNALDHLNSLLDEVRDYAAPIVLEKSASNLASIIRDTWQQIVTANPESADLEFSIECSDDFPDKIMVDHVRLGQVIWNLLENARSAVNQENGKVQVQLEVDHRSSVYRVVIQDDGPGVAKSSSDKIFEPFFTTKTKGTGLGLAICHRIVNAHSGHIDLDTKCEQGARFLIELPIRST